MAHLFTADLHFGHNFVAGLRGFDSAEEHDESMIDDINSVTHEDDILWILGDIGIRTDEETLDKVGRLKGRKMLISGNHDSTHPMHKNAWKSQAKALRVFEYVAPFQRLRLGGEDILLSHLPYSGDHTDGDRYEQYRLKDEGLPLLCGHVHGAWETHDNQWNVGVDFGAPVHEANVIWWAKMTRKMQAWYGGKNHKAHRLVYEMLVGDATGQIVHHTCHNRSCVRPEHLLAVTSAENQAEKRPSGGSSDIDDVLNVLAFDNWDPHSVRKGLAAAERLYLDHRLWESEYESPRAYRNGHIEALVNYLQGVDSGPSLEYLIRTLRGASVNG